MHSRFAVAGLLVSFALAGCQSARYVIRESDHGIVAVPSDAPRYLREAEELMREHFPDGYRVVREEEVALDETTGGRPLLDRPRSGSSSTPQGVTQRAGSAAAPPRTELRITYFRTQPPSPSLAAMSAASAAADADFGESLFSTAGMIEPAWASN